MWVPVWIAIVVSHNLVVHFTAAESVLTREQCEQILEAGKSSIPALVKYVLKTDPGEVRVQTQCLEQEGTPA